MDFENMTPGERLRYIRKDVLKISMEEMGNKIGKTKSGISLIEAGKVELIESTAKAICANYDISYLWLMEGLGEPMLDTKTALLGTLKDKYKLDERDMALLKAYLSLNSNERESIKKFINNVNEDSSE